MKKFKSPYNLKTLVSERLTLPTIKKNIEALNVIPNFDYFVSRDFKTQYNEWTEIRKENFLNYAAGPYSAKELRKLIEND